MEVKTDAPWRLFDHCRSGALSDCRRLLYPETQQKRLQFVLRQQLPFEKRQPRVLS